MKPKHFFIIVLSLLVGVGCSPTPKAGTTSSKGERSVPGNSVYYWKTVFDLNETEQGFLETHQVRRIYLRLFDVVPADKSIKNEFDFDVVPNATITFRDPIPEDVEIIPVVYITLEALLLMHYSIDDYATLIAQRVVNIADFNDLGPIWEVQLDCDWTQQTQDDYFKLCRKVRNELSPYGIQLSCTIRLWQLACDCPPVDRGVLMLYNTGNLALPKTQNAILDLNDVQTYLKGKPYGLPLDYAYPTFNWYVWFRNDVYMGLFHDIPNDTSLLQAGDVLRYEQATFEDLVALDSLVRLKMPDADSASIILYHLDSANLSNYSTDEIRQIYHHN